MHAVVLRCAVLKGVGVHLYVCVDGWVGRACGESGCGRGVQAPAAQPLTGRGRLMGAVQACCTCTLCPTPPTVSAGHRRTRRHARSVARLVEHALAALAAHQPPLAPGHLCHLRMGTGVRALGVQVGVSKRRQVPRPGQGLKDATAIAGSLAQPLAPMDACNTRPARLPQEQSHANASSHGRAASRQSHP